VITDTPPGWPRNAVLNSSAEGTLVYYFILDISDTLSVPAPRRR
jgi:hypothetical protein